MKTEFDCARQMEIKPGENLEIQGLIIRPQVRGYVQNLVQTQRISFDEAVDRFVQELKVPAEGNVEELIEDKGQIIRPLVRDYVRDWAKIQGVSLEVVADQFAEDLKVPDEVDQDRLDGIRQSVAEQPVCGDCPDGVCGWAEGLDLDNEEGGDVETVY